MNARFISPMLATLGRPPARFARFAVEAKYDGQRGLAVVDGGSVTLLSRNGADITRTFPEIIAALPGIGRLPPPHSGRAITPIELQDNAVRGRNS